MARQFNGTTQHGVCTSELLSANVNYTLVVWFKVPTTQTNRGYMAGSGRSSNAFARGNGIMLRGDQTGDPIAAYGTDGSDTFLNGSGVSEGAWHVAAATRVGGGQTAQATQLKIDGLTKVTGTTPGGVSGTANNFLVGANRTNTGFIDRFAGLIDAIAVYNVVKPDAFLDALAAFTAPDEEDAELVELWRFDSDTGATSVGVNGNTITWTGSPAYVADTPFAPPGPAVTSITDPISGVASITVDTELPDVDGITFTYGSVVQAQSFTTADNLTHEIASVTRNLLPPTGQITVKLLEGVTVVASEVTNLAAPPGWEAVTIGTPSTAEGSVYYGYAGDAPEADVDQLMHDDPGNTIIDSTGVLTQTVPRSVNVLAWDDSAEAYGDLGAWIYTPEGGLQVVRSGIISQSIIRQGLIT